MFWSLRVQDDNNEKFAITIISLDIKISNVNLIDPYPYLFLNVYAHRFPILTANG